MTIMGFKKKQCKNDLSAWHDKLWKVFSVYIRLRDAIEAGMQGYIRCISCGDIYHWTNGDAGHYLNRKYKAIVYDEDNVHFQCRDCNRFTEGNQAAYRINLVAKIGEDRVRALEEKKNWPAGFTIDGLKIRRAEYKAKVAEMKKII